MARTVSLLIRPRRSLLVTALVSILLAMAPIFGVLYWFAAEHDTVPTVVIAHAVVVVLSFGILLRQLSVFSAITDTELIGRGIFSPMLRVPLDRIATVDLVETYTGSATETTTQLLVRDESGARLFRMRGNFWHRDEFEAFARALPRPVHTSSEPISMADFFRDYPGSAYWFENRPVLRPLAVIVTLLITIAIIVMTMQALGMPSAIG